MGPLRRSGPSHRRNISPSLCSKGGPSLRMSPSAALLQRRMPHSAAAGRTIVAAGRQRRWRRVEGRWQRAETANVLKIFRPTLKVALRASRKANRKFVSTEQLPCAAAVYREGAEWGSLNLRVPGIPAWGGRFGFFVDWRRRKTL